MKQSKKIIYNFVNILLDVICIYGAYLFSAYIWLHIVNSNEHLGTFGADYMLQFATYYTILVVFFMLLSGKYNEKQIKSIFVQISTFWSNGIIILLSGVAFLYLNWSVDFSRGVLILFYFLSSILLTIKHLLFHYIHNIHYKKGRNLKKVCLVGSGHLALQYINDIENNKQYGFVVSSIVGSEAIKSHPKYYGDFSTLDKLLSTSFIDEVVFAMEADEIKEIVTYMQIAEKNGHMYSIIPFYNDMLPAKPTVEVIGNTKLISLWKNKLDNYGWQLVKRTADIIISVTALILLSPLLIITAIGIKITSPGPIIFNQVRLGYHNKPFKLYKFRSMCVNNLENKGWTTTNDSRKTVFGSFIRKFSIDELPQLFNILCGDMSLVGPRPEIPYFVDCYKKEIPLYMLKHRVRPGLTGWAQVNGLRGDTSISERIRYDIEYIENWSVFFDLYIIFKTIAGGFLNDEKVIISSRSGKDNN